MSSFWAPVAHSLSHSLAPHAATLLPSRRIRSSALFPPPFRTAPLPFHDRVPYGCSSQRVSRAFQRPPNADEALQTHGNAVHLEEMERVQQTLGAPVARAGVGLHRGETATVRLLPAAAGSGRHFAVCRPGDSGVARAAGGGGGGEDEIIAAALGSVTRCQLSTTLGNGRAEVQTVEHLLSALEGMGVDNVLVEIEGGAEVPILDGSASGWVDAIREAGVVPASGPGGGAEGLARRRPPHAVSVQEGDSFVAAFPSDRPRLSYGIDFRQLAAIGRQWFTWEGGEAYEREVAPARTFGIMEQIEQLRAAGLIKGGSLENALVCSAKDGWLNPPLRFADEPCRHKMLDLVGDLALCGGGACAGLPLAHVVAYKASHALHVKFGAALVAACEGGPTPGAT